MNAIGEVDRIARIAETLFQRTGVDGVYGRTAIFQGVVEALEALISGHRPTGAEVLRFPPVMSRKHLERHGYLKSFPNLLGCVSCLGGTESEIRRVTDRPEEGEPWTDALEPSDLVLTPAACYPLYPIVAARGPVPRAGLLFDVACDCFRREPSRDIDRLQAFRQREFVCVGSSEQVQGFRGDWIEWAQMLVTDLGLPHRIRLASDPFFGPGRSASIQKLLKLKFELVIPIISQDQPTACISFNNHQDHFSQAWELTTVDATVVHTGCIGFGMDRLALALFATHGANPADWPTGARKVLKL